MSLDKVRAVADAVLYEGYLLYPYRASSRKNQSRWQFGVLGPPSASTVSFGEDPAMSMQCLLDPGAGTGAVTVTLRFLQLQVREVQRLQPADSNDSVDGGYEPVAELMVDGSAVTSWDEAVEREITLPTHALLADTDTPVEFAGGEDVDQLTDSRGELVGRVVRRRWPLTARIHTHGEADDGCVRLSVSVTNEHPEPVDDKDAAIRSSLIGAYLLLQAQDADFISLLEPPDKASAAAARCRQRRCFPVLAGDSGTTDIVFAAPIILYDYPQVAEESAGALFDSTEIDEILTLRVMTMTDDEKAQARATDPRAAEIIDRCDGMTAEDLQQLHGVFRDPHTPARSEAVESELSDLLDGAPPEYGVAPVNFDNGDAPWWDPKEDASVAPGTDAVEIDGVSVARGSFVRVHPSKRSDAQDIFFADQVARVTAIVFDVDGGVHVGLVLVDDPATEMHDWYGRYFYFDPVEVTPLSPDEAAQVREGQIQTEQSQAEREEIRP